MRYDAMNLSLAFPPSGGLSQAQSHPHLLLQQQQQHLQLAAYNTSMSAANKSPPVPHLASHLHLTSSPGAVIGTPPQAPVVSTGLHNSLSPLSSTSTKSSSSADSAAVLSGFSAGLNPFHQHGLGLTHPGLGPHHKDRLNFLQQHRQQQEEQLLSAAHFDSAASKHGLLAAKMSHLFGGSHPTSLDQLDRERYSDFVRKLSGGGQSHHNHPYLRVGNYLTGEPDAIRDGRNSSLSPSSDRGRRASSTSPRPLSPSVSPTVGSIDKSPDPKQSNPESSESKEDIVGGDTGNDTGCSTSQADNATSESPEGVVSRMVRMKPSTFWALPTHPRRTETVTITVTTTATLMKMMNFYR
ncbi:hypothetical protein EGW08_003185 [Elysia chlorotica]|uniref:Uncharacterized protein n=1 Tax=Elysia chlorotica TaxID=188477 RepID=A0A3S1A2N9_ELYCH|nr:hypothetical protein EGW08_003185 [Elysia chlorotica]